MVKQIEQEIQQAKKFVNEYVKLDVNLMFTASYLGTIKTTVLKPYGISWQQFNILRILRGRHPEPASIKLLTERMIDKTSNTSRLVDKLTKKRMVSRTVNQHDRRIMDVTITEQGLELIACCSEKLEAEITERLSALSREEAEQMNHLLDKIRY
ncbi:MAG: MarR family transcriptional regulator [Saprospirales bacterium]|nr:MAG: MarR family transcriptional regulator [Saprospirales bacterium]